MKLCKKEMFGHEFHAAVDPSNNIYMCWESDSVWIQ